MSTLLQRWKVTAGALVLLVAIYGCEATYGGSCDAYIGRGGYYVGGAYEEPELFLGGWGRGYDVGPPPGGDHASAHDGGGRRAPSIPNRIRGGDN